MYCIYHSRDLDGHCSGAIVKKKYPNAVLIGFDYGQPLEKLINAIPYGEPVIMVDVSMPMDDMIRLASHSGGMTWIDHHESAIKAYEEMETANFVGVLQNGKAACEITWKHLFKDPLPHAVELLGKYDTWREHGTPEWENKILPFQFGMRVDGHTADNFPDKFLNWAASYVGIHEVVQVGKTILKYQGQQNKLAMHGAFEFDFLGHIAIACNGGGFNSQAFESVYDPEKHDLMMPFKFNGKHWVFSLYTDKEDVVCSELAKRMGGGGHRKAAGFQVDHIHINHFEGHVEIEFNVE